MFSDLIVEDREGRPIVLVEVTLEEVTPADIENLVARLTSNSPAIPFGMMVDLETMVVIAGPPGNPAPLPERIDTIEVLRHYAPEFAGRATPQGYKKIFRFFFTGLVKDWLEDLVCQWRTDEPPKPAVLRESGLLNQIEGNFVVNVELMRDDPVR